MSDASPKISKFKPVVLPDQRRVTLEMVVDNLPTVFSNVSFEMPTFMDDPPPSQKQPPQPAPANSPSPYPDIELSILDEAGREVASLLIVEHKETYTALTLHLRRPDPHQQYTARAQMSYQNKTLEVIEAPFTLTQVKTNE